MVSSSFSESARQLEAAAKESAEKGAALLREMYALHAQDKIPFANTLGFVLDRKVQPGKALDDMLAGERKHRALVAAIRESGLSAKLVMR